MDNALDFDPAEATEYANRLNIVTIGLVCGWLGSTVIFWMQAFGPLRSLNRASPDEAPFWRLVGSLFTSYAISFLPILV